MYYSCSVYIKGVSLWKDIEIMNAKVLELLAKQEVKWEAKFGRTITLEEAITKQRNKLTKLQRENRYKY